MPTASFPALIIARNAIRCSTGPRQGRGSGPGRLKLLDFAHSAGKTPRFFTFDPSSLYAYVTN